MPNNHQRNDRKEAKNARKIAEKEAKHPITEAPSGQNPAESGKPDASLVEALQALAADMAKAESDADAERGLKRLQQIRADFLGGAPESPAAREARRKAEALVAWVEARLEQLRQQLARKRRAQEGEVMEVIAKQREAEAPSLLPTELVDSVVHSTAKADPEEKRKKKKSAAATAPEHRTSEEKKKPGKAAKTIREEKKEEPTPGEETPGKETPGKETPGMETPGEHTPGAQTPEATTPSAETPTSETPQTTPETPPQETRTPETAAPEERAPEVRPPEARAPEERAPEARPPEARPPEARAPEARPPEANPPEQAGPAEPPKQNWTKFEVLAAHLAASVKEDPKFFDKLRSDAKRDLPRIRAPEDNEEAETHYRAVHRLSKRLVNTELHAKALAKAEENHAPQAPLLRTTARELKGFLQDLKKGREKLPEMAGEYDRLFSGYAEQFAAMKPDKGSGILEKCREEPVREAGEQIHAPEAGPRPEAPEAEAPQLVLRADAWHQQ